MIRGNKSAPVDRFAQLNDPGLVFKNPDQLAYVRTLVDTLRQLSQEVIAKNQVAPHVMLLSPDGIAYQVAVQNDGTLQVVNVRTGVIATGEINLLLWGDETGNLELWGDETGDLLLWGDTA